MHPDPRAGELVPCIGSSFPEISIEISLDRRLSALYGAVCGFDPRGVLSLHLHGLVSNASSRTWQDQPQFSIAALDSSPSAATADGDGRGARADRQPHARRENEERGCRPSNRTDVAVPVPGGAVVAHAARSAIIADAASRIVRGAHRRMRSQTHARAATPPDRALIIRRSASGRHRDLRLSISRSLVCERAAT